MSIEHPEAARATTSRRAFLTRAAAGGALVTAASALPLDRLVQAAGAASTTPDLDDPTYAAIATPYEMAAVQAYQAAISSGAFTGQDAQTMSGLLSNHQTVVDTLTAYLPTTAAAPLPDPGLQKTVTKTITKSSPAKTTLATLMDLESTLAATHLAGLGQLTEFSLARTLAQVLSVENEQSALLARMLDKTIESQTPTSVDTTAALSLTQN